MNLQIVLAWLCDAISPMAKCWTTKRRSGRGVADGFPSYEIDRDVGEHDALGRPMTTNGAATYAMPQNGTNRQRGRAALIALWVTQVALALMFVMAGGSTCALTPGDRRRVGPSPSASNLLIQCICFFRGTDK